MTNMFDMIRGAIATLTSQDSREKGSQRRNNAEAVLDDHGVWHETTAVQFAVVVLVVVVIGKSTRWLVDTTKAMMIDSRQEDRAKAKLCSRKLRINKGTLHTRAARSRVGIYIHSI
jgi:hypothetical protein